MEERKDVRAGFEFPFESHLSTIPTFQFSTFQGGSNARRTCDYSSEAGLRGALC